MLKKTTILIISIAMLIMLCACESSEVKQAREAYEDGDYTTVVELLSAEEELTDELKDMLNDSQEKLYEEQYSAIETEIKTAEEYEENFFAQYIDMKPLKAAKDKANEALSNSDKEAYAEVLEALQSENKDVKKKIKEETKKLYNSPTTKESDAEYPFKVDKKVVGEGFDVQPEYMVSSEFPDPIYWEAPETTDGVEGLVMMHGIGSSEEFTVSDVDSKEITVNTEDYENGKKEKAIVNTEVKLLHEPFAGGDYRDTRPMYLCKDRKGTIVLLVPDFGEGDFYVPYK